MGICSSCESTSVATAKLILQDGRLQEFSYPVKVSYLLQRDPTSFICNSDEMDFDDVVSAVSEDEELQLGQLYFALPMSLLRQRLEATDMAALAVKASSALRRTGGGEKCGCGRTTAAVFYWEKGGRKSRRVADGGGVGEGGVRRGRNGGGCGGGGRGRRRKNFKAKLSAIPE